MAKLRGKLWLLFGVIAIGSSIALSFLSRHRELYERPYPGDEGGRGFLFTLLAIAVLDLGLVLMTVGVVIYVRHLHGNSLIQRLLSVAAAFFCAFAFWRAVSGLLGGLRAGVWPVAIGMIAGVVSYAVGKPSKDI